MFPSTCIILEIGGHLRAFPIYDDTSITMIRDSWNKRDTFKKVPYPREMLQNALVVISSEFVCIKIGLCLTLY